MIHSMKKRQLYGHVDCLNLDYLTISALIVIFRLSSFGWSSESFAKEPHDMVITGDQRSRSSMPMSCELVET